MEGAGSRVIFVGSSQSSFQGPRKVMADRPHQQTRQSIETVNALTDAIGWRPRG